MGNQHSQSKGSGSTDLTSQLKGYPMYFHTSHSPNIQLSNDKRSAKRIESFCKGICFGSRPVAINERVYIRFAEVSLSWSGVLRFGYSSNDPAHVDPNSLPRYACPDLTNKPGFWAKALPERMAEQGNVLFFQVNRHGEVLYGLNDQDRGGFFSGLPTNMPLWPVVDIYGNTTSMEFVDGRQLNNISSPLDDSLLTQFAGISHNPPVQAEAAPVTPTRTPVSVPSYPQPPQAASSQALPYPLNPQQPAPALSRAHTYHAAGALPNNIPNLGVTHYTSYSFKPFPLHSVHGRNVSLSYDKQVAVRLLEEYCNGYVFTNRPFQCGERIVIQILSVDKTYEGGIAFGMTACDPKTLKIDDLPDDSDFLLDRPEYWVVNKDVCTKADVRDELSFHLTIEGEVRYGRNGHHITTLMHIDKTLPMWAFFDVYGSVQKIKILGLAHMDRSPSVSYHRQNSSNLQSVVLPPARNLSTPSLPSGSNPNPPPRPPPPRASPGSLRLSPGHSPNSSMRRELTPPTLPPKQRTQTPSPSMSAVPPPPSLSNPTSPIGAGPPLPPTTPGAMSLPILPPPLIPVPAEPSPPCTPAPLPPKLTKPSPAAKPAIPPRLIDKQKPPPPIPSRNTESPSNEKQSKDDDRAMEDNANNECCVCWENPPNCVVYTCGHMCMCYKCAQDIKNNQDGLCPMCRQEIKDIIKIFRS